MEPRHRAEIGGQGFALACLKLLEQIIHGLLDELLCGVVLLRGALLVRGIAAGAKRRILTVRRALLLLRLLLQLKLMFLFSFSAVTG